MCRSVFPTISFWSNFEGEEKKRTKNTLETGISSHDSAKSFSETGVVIMWTLQQAGTSVRTTQIAAKSSPLTTNPLKIGPVRNWYEH